MTNKTPNLRIGQGYDLHSLIKGNGIILGGVHIPCDKKIVAHSDGDLLLHAICDALLGAASIKDAEDIGALFPDNDPKWQGVASANILITCAALLNSNNYEIVNIDSTIVLEKPILAVYKPQMQKNIARLLKIEPGFVSIKATRGEGVDAIGKGKAIAVHCVCLLAKNKD